MASELSAEKLNQVGSECLPGLVGMTLESISDAGARGSLPVTQRLMAPNGFLHAASVIALADSCCGYATLHGLPEGATSFTTIELKSNFLGTARDGVIECVASPSHRGRTTQVWDATVTHRETGKTIAMFRCTQMILYPKA